ncbi:hypothetical protein E8E13_009413 [Curvularia kusanoi]|uniref:GIY-YIG domain-containing protein n=1 Tax=Curvularia kusanoi TaxID=90978 RepID=A0A9P4WAQ7_CURKU|nr:hypothetical protein E8E13_009413 [Curvularia kusanoi]
MENAKKRFRQALMEPDKVISACKGLLRPFVERQYAKGVLFNPNQYRYRVTSSDACPTTPGIYVLCLHMPDQTRFFYVGQAANIKERVHASHFNERYRNRNPSLLYYMWTKCESVDIILVVSDEAKSVLEGSGPTLDILEQWVSIIFRTLQPPDLELYISPKIRDQLKITSENDHLNRGLNVREPLAQTFKPNEWRLRGVQHLRNSPVEDFRAYYEERRKRKEAVTEQAQRRQSLLNGQIYTGAVWKRNGLDDKFGIFYVFRIMNILIPIDMGTYHRWRPGSMRVKLDLRPEGQLHPQCIVAGLTSPMKYRDPARRLGIYISGTLAGDCWETREKPGSLYYKHPDDIQTGFWARQTGNGCVWVPRWNKIIDWLECKDTRIIRPRRCYPRSQGSRYDQMFGYRRNDLYTLHPADTSQWRQLHTVEEVEAWLLEGKMKKAPVTAPPVTDEYTSWRDHWHAELKIEEEKGTRNNPNAVLDEFDEAEIISFEDDAMYTNDLAAVDDGVNDGVDYGGTEEPDEWH